MSATTDEIKIVAAPEESETAEGAEQPAAKPRRQRVRGLKYRAARANVDRTREYDAFAAVEVVKRLSYSKFDGTLTADVVIREPGDTVSVTFPHSTGKTLRVAIVTDELLKNLEAGTIDFDILVTSPNYMPKLAKFARVLGPRGLMPNPKNGTISPDPERRKTELEGGTLTLKAEKKAPLMHVTIGKTNMETKDLVENLQTLVKALKGKIEKLSLSATMSPGVKVAVEK